MFRSFLAPRDGKILLYTVCVLGCWLYTKQRRISLRERNRHKCHARRRYLLGFLYHRIICWLFSPANTQRACCYVTFTPLPFFSLYMECTSYDNFSLLHGVFSTFFWVGCIFYISLIENLINSINQSKRYHVLQNCLLPLGLGQDRFQIIEGTEPPEEVHKKNDY